MAVVKKKIQKEYFDLIASGKKKTELRLADFDIAEGDTLILEEWINDNHGNRKPSGRKIETTATYIMKTKDYELFPQEDIDKYGFQIIQFEVKK